MDEEEEFGVEAVEVGEGDSKATQLEDGSPRIATPLRMAAPGYLRLPARRVEIGRDEQLRQSAFAPAAFVRWQRREEGAWVDPETPSAKFRAQREAQGGYMNKKADFQLLAASSRRGQQTSTEAASYLARGIIEDNMGRFKAAIENYGRLLKLARQAEDTALMAIALNHLGTDYLHLCLPAVDHSIRSPFCIARCQDGAWPQLDTPEARVYLDKAIAYHDEHLGIADEAGEFVARTNLGISFGALGNPDTAAQHHQEALRLAIRMQSVHAQAIAVGNLGALALQQSDHATAQACMEQHLALVQTLKDPTAELGARMQLGALFAVQNDAKAAVQHYQQAQEVADREGEMATLKRINCNIAVVTARGRMDEYFAELRAEAKV